MKAAGIIIVLGSPNDEQGNLHSVALERSALARQLYAENPDSQLLLTGGFGAHFNTTGRPHAFYLMRWLGGHGVPATAFLPFAESRNTLEDAALSRPIVVAAGARNATVVTSDYHLERARFIFEREYAGTGIALQFVAALTDERRCRLDLAALRNHERAALIRLQQTAG